MASQTNKWMYLCRHMLPSLSGFLKGLFSHPIFSLKLATEHLKAHLRAHLTFFSDRQPTIFLRTPDKFVIESTGELASYWSLFIERECGTGEWKKILPREPQPLILDV